MMDDIDMDTVAEISESFRPIIRALGMDPYDPNLEGTPVRVARMLIEMTRGQFDWDEQAGELLGITFPSTYDEMIVVSDIRVVGLCPHHFLPIEYEMTIGYIPRKSTVGLSKLPRLCELLAARAVMQEQLTDDIAGSIQKYLEPNGIGVMIRGRHGCLAYRGARQEHALMSTCRLIGSFKDIPATKAEFMAHAVP